MVPAALGRVLECKAELVDDTMQAMLDVVRILIAIIALGLGAFLFNRDAKRLVLVPIERMMQKVCCSLTEPLTLLARAKPGSPAQDADVQPEGGNRLSQHKAKKRSGF